jgi:hypothetical protein
MKYLGHSDTIRAHFDSLQLESMAFCFGRTICGEAYSNLAYYRIVRKIDEDYMCLSIEVETDDPNEPDDHRRWLFHPMQVYQIEEPNEDIIRQK